MHASKLIKLSLFSCVFFMAGCASKYTEPEKFSGFLNDYSNLKQVESASGKPELAWVDPDYKSSSYDSIVYNSITYYPTPQPTTQIGKQVMVDLLNYTNGKIKGALAQKKPLVTVPGAHSLIFRGAITGVSSEKEGLQFYEVLPVTLLVASTQMLSGHRTMDTHLFFEAELIDAITNKPVIKVVRKDDGKELRNEKIPMTLDSLQKVIDDMVLDISKFNPAINK